MRLLAVLVGIAPLFAQSSRIPVVLLNGYQATCGSTSDSSATFGSMEAFLNADGWQVSFFDNCSVNPGTTGSARPSIEQLGQAFGAFLVQLGAPQVDVVAHSMGGLIVRAYLSGKQPQGGFAPPAVLIRKAIFLASPHAGILAITGILGDTVSDAQTIEMFAGSQFLWDLGTWSQRTDDLRDVDALSIAGNSGGTGDSAHSNDGVVVVTSASLAATLGSARARVLPYCHENNLPSFLCQGPGIAFITSRTHPSYEIVTSFLLDTPDWQAIGADASQDPALSQHAGVLFDIRDASGNSYAKPGNAVLIGASKQLGILPWNSQGVFFADYLNPGPYQILAQGATYSLPVVAGGHVAIQAKPGTTIDIVEPAAGNVSTLSRAPGMLISIYGSNLQDATVTIGGTSTPIYFNSATLINTIVPDGAAGLVVLSVANSSGQDALNVLLEISVPTIFSADSSGTGAALAFHASDSSPVSPANPAHAGETISIFLTGLGVPAQTPIMQVGGSPANVSAIYPLSPGVFRLDFVTPAISASPVQIQASSGRFSSNLVTLDVAP